MKKSNDLLLDAVIANSNGVVPPSLLDRPEVSGAAAAHTLATCSTMMEGKAGPKLCITHHTLSDHLVWHPVGGAGSVLQKV